MGIETVTDWLGRTWAAATTRQPSPSPTTVLLSAVAVLVVLAVPVLWRLSRHALTIVHESAHAGVALLVGRRLSGIRVHSDTSGLTVSTGRPRGPGMVLTAVAGYPGPAVLGAGAAWLVSRGYALGLVWSLILLVVLVLVQVRNVYGLWAVLVTVVALAVVAVDGTPAVHSAAATTVTWFLLLGAPRAVLEMQVGRRRLRRRRSADSSDAGLLARLTRLPAGLWVGVLFLVCLAALALGATWLVGPSDHGWWTRPG